MLTRKDWLKNSVGQNIERNIESNVPVTVAQMIWIEPGTSISCTEVHQSNESCFVFSCNHTPDLHRQAQCSSQKWLTTEGFLHLQSSGNWEHLSQHVQTKRKLHWGFHKHKWKILAVFFCTSVFTMKLLFFLLTLLYLFSSCSIIIFVPLHTYALPKALAMPQLHHCHYTTCKCLHSHTLKINISPFPQLTCKTDFVPQCPGRFQDCSPDKWLISREQTWG